MNGEDFGCCSHGNLMGSCPDCIPGFGAPTSAAGLPQATLPTKSGLPMWVIALIGVGVAYLLLKKKEDYKVIPAIGDDQKFGLDFKSNPRKPKRRPGLKYSQLSPKAQKTAQEYYIDGWLDSHPEDDEVADLDWADEMCRDTEDDVLYNKSGLPIES